MESTLYLLYSFITLTFIYYPGFTTGNISISAKTSLKVRNEDGISDESVITDETIDTIKEQNN